MMDLYYEYNKPKYIYLDQLVYDELVGLYRYENISICKNTYDFISLWNSCNDIEEVAQLLNMRKNRARKRAQKIRKKLWDRIFLKKLY